MSISLSCAKCGRVKTYERLALPAGDIRYYHCPFCGYNHIEDRKIPKVINHDTKSHINGGQSSANKGRQGETTPPTFDKCEPMKQSIAEGIMSPNICPICGFPKEGKTDYGQFCICKLYEGGI